MREVPPWTTQVGLHFRGFARDLAGRKDKAIALLLGSRGGCDVTVAPGMNATSLEESRSCSKDEIDVSGDERILEVVPAAVQQNGVLPSQKAAIAEK